MHPAASLPKDLLDPSFNFSCDERHDGFYASIPHKCQVYHNCLFNQRYDFLCANYTVFDQKNFICHYASEVDCENSWKHYDRNNDLYETTTTTTTTTPAPQIIYVQRPPPLNGPGRRRKPPHLIRPDNRRPTTTTPSPYYDYDYPDYHYHDYYEYDEKTTTTTTTARPRRRPIRTRPGRPRGRPGDRARPGRPRDDNNPLRSSRIQGNGARPRDQDLPQGGTGGRRRPNRPRGNGPRRRKPTTTTTTTEATQDYYYDDYYDYYYDYDETSSSTTTTTTAAPPTRRKRPSRVRGGGARPQPVEDQATAATQIDRTSPVTGKQSDSGAPRVSVRRKPLDNASGPKFPSRRSQAAAAGAEGDTNEAPLNQDQTSTAIESVRETTGVRSRVRMPRPRKTPTTTTTSLPVEYDYY
ncbi:hypothetical protein Pcinc_030566 [Petrolisthes cinctipes]|uniref:Chitin-binding type-2 domain-containing protein n=1 Tax=Petrolisthes cinctipes TaxID=88211 RepID=A0AAE1K5W1_PETCI|nr:hypothetical protein Pcinc_030566 [Petrolisthes cinctipes]